MSCFSHVLWGATAIVRKFDSSDGNRRQKTNRIKQPNGGLLAQKRKSMRGGHTVQGD